MAEPTLLKIWNSWEDGVGHLVDREGTNGMYYAEGFIGTPSELRPGPHKFTVNVGASVTLHDDESIQRGFEESFSISETYLYLSWTGPGTIHNHLVKIDLRNSTFGNVLGVHNLDSGLTMGQPARYLGDWILPSTSDSGNIRRLVVGSGATSNDTVTLATGTLRANHLLLNNSQLVRVLEGSGGGVSILKRDGVALTAADWGAFFPVGDRDEFPQNLMNLEGSLFVTKRFGIFSFNDRGRAGTVLESIAGWKAHQRRRVYWVSWFGGLVFPTPGGLMFFRPGSPPYYLGVEAVSQGGTAPFPGVPSAFNSGRYLGIDTVGDYLFALYIPSLTSATGLVMVGTPVSGNRAVPNVKWDVIATYTNPSPAESFGVQTPVVAAAGFPTSSLVARPTLWFNDNDQQVSYQILNPQGHPLRDGSEDQRITTSATAYLSELRFPVPVSLSHLVVYTQDFASGDELQVSLITEQGETRLGAPIEDSGYRHILRIDRHDVRRAMVRLGWTATNTADRAPPSVAQIELWGSLNFQGNF